MKHKILTSLILLALVLGSPWNASAQSWNETRNLEDVAFIDIGANEATVTFAELGFRETSLVSPFDSTRLLFSIPSNWTLTAGGTIQLDYEVTLSGADAATVGTENNPYGGGLQITFNDQLVGNIDLRALGPQTIEFELPENSLVPVRQDGRHQLVISLSAQSSCLYNIRTLVVIKPTSTFTLPFEVSAPDLNLSRLPAPFFLRNALLPDRTVVVVPNEPDVQELGAALNVMAGFGSLVGEVFDISLSSAGDLTEEDLTNSNLIFVGRPEQFERLGEIPFPLAVENNQFANLPTESQSDGVIQMAGSPWNESKAVLLISGASSEAVVKAAQAVSTGRILIYENPALAYVADVQLLSTQIPLVQDFTLQSLGYQTVTLTGIGVDSVQYIFNAAKEQLKTKEAYIDLVYFHSGLIDYGSSSFSVELNGELISSNVFAKESEQLSTLQIKIPPGILRFGENRLTISSRMLIITSCDATGFSTPWLTISDQTSIHLPPGGPDDSAVPLLDLKSYPDLFTSQSDLGDVTFVLAQGNTPAWKLAGQVAYQLGRAANPLIPNLQASYAGEVPQEVLATDSLIVIGKSSTNTMLAEINDQLPAPFDLQTDTAAERNMQVVYRIPQGMNVGYLQLLNSPYNAEKPILVLSGNSDEGLVLAGNALSVSELNSQLTGVFAVTNGSQVATGSASSTFSAVGTLLPPDAAVVTTPVPGVPVPAAAATLPPPPWLMPLLIASGIAILLILLLVIIGALARRRTETALAFTPQNNKANRDGKDS